MTTVSTSAAPTKPLPKRAFSWGVFAITVTFILGTRPLRYNEFSAGLAVVLVGMAIAVMILGTATDGYFRRGLNLLRPVHGMLILYPLAAMVWSDFGKTPFATMFPFVVGTILGISLAGLRTQQVRFILRTMALSVLVLNPLLFAINKASSDEGWIGAYDHKNVAGRLTCLALLILAGEALERDHAKPIRLALAGAVAVGILELFATQSAASIVAAIIGIAALAVVQKITGNPRSGFMLQKMIRSRALLFSGLSILVFLGAVASWAIAGPEIQAWVVDKLGRDVEHNTLSTRQNLWRIVLNDIFQRPFLGWGYSPLDIGDRSLGVTSAFDPKNGHNGFLQVMFQFGIPLGLVFNWLFIRTVPRVLIAESARRLPKFAPPLAVAMLVFAVAYSVLSAGPSRATIFWSLFLWMMLRSNPNHLRFTERAAANGR